ncbi:Tol-Pal system beta propeller repeat protein TolB [Rickettsia prowazekii]|uniref:Tol-Pal system protein TolB n=2 Tax=Rickettsia prowazekii TaxID=782 RepID=TOLB_RICPR|nr:Tol-Pal system beta propeller repeat protein TolB [Rickettsia prowazekii]Q9ZDM5.1 RecName: Full=Tol-Pal system protein TolB; Flags: Precursor [Rickettsia prowazekii str. Madrid E]EOB09658.1 Protein TolB [Rickettsia prowazekii str. GvF12]ADE29817.1 TolB protein precursor [Rickettsia prowazekii str. Rp22]AFE49119.1 translocation protein TolB [Rickettsia prowazekii str. Chernikova]AFE49965.1 translocation protein TolB [Rickettsia prowazekii str. Katsinyian]AFE50809.1 translocation protein Tol
MRNIVYFILTLFSLTSYALETINIEHGRVDPTPIAVNKFNADSSNNDLVGRDVVKVISNDLKISGLFRPISSASFIEEQTGIKYKPLFAAWRQINASLLVNGEVKTLENGKLKISFILWDTFLEKQLTGALFEVPTKLWRRAAHKIADKIYEKITGDPGYFDTKIVYVSESTVLPKIKRIALMDYDGANNKYLTNGKSLVLTPRFAHSADKIFYVSYATKSRALVYEKDLKTGKESVVGDFVGISFAPRFSPDGKKAVMSIAKNGSTHIYEIDLATKQLNKLTNGFGINTSPSYSPDGKKIVFNSDKNGVPQLYIMNSDGSDVQRISFGVGSYASPSWSPRGDYIAFTKIIRQDGEKTFNIGIMKAYPQDHGNSERIITSGYLVDSPCWSPNGRVIMFSKGWPSKANAPGKNKIFTIDLTGHNEREIITPADASDPEWSGILN